MNSRTKFLFFAIILIGLLAAVELFYPKPVSWRISLSSDDTIPFGTSALRESIDKIFSGNEVTFSRESFYMMDSILDADAYLVISSSFQAGRDDFESMMDMISQGASVLISAYSFDQALMDSLKITVKDDIIKDLYPSRLIPQEDSSFLEMRKPRLPEKFIYRRMDAPYYFEIDKESNINWQILAQNEEQLPVAVTADFGEGQLILSCTPLIFTNYYLLYTDNYKLTEALLSQLPNGSLHWMEFYSRGRGGPQTPLRYILSTTPLRWAYFITIFGILAFILFEAKRKQRPVPIISPLQNDSLEFIKTVGNLYYEGGDHKNIAEKRIQYLLEFIRSHYHLSTTDIDKEEFQNQLANKSGKPLLNIEALFTMIGILLKKDSIHEDELLILNRKIEAFIRT